MTVNPENESGFDPVDWPLAVIGCGRVGGALAVLLERAGFSVTGLCDRHAGRRDDVARRLVGGPVCAARPEVAVAGARLVLIATQDRNIAAAAAELAAAAIDWQDRAAAHLSGLHPASLLAPLARSGALVFSFHPLQSIASIDMALDVLPGSFFAFEGDEQAADLALGLATVLRGTLVPLVAADKALYHGAAVVASNFFIALEYMAFGMLEAAGIEPDRAREMLLPLVRGSLENLARNGPVDALTGPIVRGDDATVAAHLGALAVKLPGRRSLYRELARLNVELAQLKSGVSLADFPALGTAAGGGEHEREGALTAGEGFVRPAGDKGF
ncbi:MAG: DUF2520 domain-containing protein [Deltaproteobacteria bacterium]|nr:DUF2520 domain-containing protein [Candidatus Anaeroferrophillacea bacterium]